MCSYRNSKTSMIVPPANEMYSSYSSNDTVPAYCCVASFRTHSHILEKKKNTALTYTIKRSTKGKTTSSGKSSLTDVLCSFWWRNNTLYTSTATSRLLFLLLDCCCCWQKSVLINVKTTIVKRKMFGNRSCNLCCPGIDRSE